MLLTTLHSDLFAQSGWFPQSPLPTGNTLFGVSFAGPNIGTAVGEGGTIIRTTDGGSSWSMQVSGITVVPYGVSFTDANTGTAVGASGKILRTTNGGSSWSVQPSGLTNAFNGVAFTDSDSGTIAGAGGTILRTTNRGSNWSSQISGTTSILYGIALADARNGTAVGNGGTILRLRTTNGGSNWTVQSTGTTRDFNGLSFTDANIGTVVGIGGVILRTNTGGVTGVAQESASSIPSGFSLMQNYPNPFNPTTTIRFTVGGVVAPSGAEGRAVGRQQSAVSKVRLAVYDLLGRELAVLVNDRKEPGTYEVEFNGSGLASGVYLCRMQADSFVETRRLLLLR
jgi:hypothetical protein